MLDAHRLGIPCNLHRLESGVFALGHLTKPCIEQVPKKAFVGFDQLGSSLWIVLCQTRFDSLDQIFRYKICLLNR